MTETVSESESTDVLTGNHEISLQQLLEDDGVECGNRTYDHPDPDHCETDADGRVVVGVTNDSGEVLLLRGKSGSHVILPNGVVDPSEEFRDVARSTVEELTNSPVTIESIERLRRVEHRHDGTVQNRTVHLLFAGTFVNPVDEPATDEDQWTAGWYDDVPVDVAEEGDAITDIRHFL